MSSKLAELERIFYKALAAPDREQRSAYLDQTCGADAELRQRVDALLLADAEAVDFLPLPDHEATAPAASLAEGPGSVIGPYRLLEQIGEGGFGVVFMAEQQQPIRRHVALKVNKPGMDTKQVVARFEAERQALALMEHPDIARVFDAGTTATGRPYFVMELVRGVPITEYCDENRLPADERLRLFQVVCAAVQHAHQKGIIHRDLKPSNILVTLHGDLAVPKVIDFGVAKAMQGRLTEKTFFTEFRQLVGTPTYMSPEQAQMSALNVDVRSDVYSLGVLLYVLLTGTTPIEASKAATASIDELRRWICDVDPPSPSARVTSLSAETRTLLAKKFRCDPAHLAVRLRNDLDWIVMRCLEKDPSRRYQTVEALARDVDRYLKNEPVEARRPTRRYRVQKFIVRNKGFSIAIAATTLGLIISLLAVSVALVSQLRQRQIAEQARAEAEFNLASRLQSQLKYSDAESSYRKLLTEAPLMTPMDRQRVAQTFLRLGQVSRIRSEKERWYREGLAAMREAYPQNDANVVQALLTLALFLRSEQRQQEAEPLFAEAYHAQQQVSPVDHYAMGVVALQLGHIRGVLGNAKEGETLLRESIACYERCATKNERSIALAQLELGKTLVWLGRFSDAESVLLASHRVLESTDDFFYSTLALAGLYSKWDQSEPGRKYDTKSAEWTQRALEQMYSRRGDS